MKTYHIITIGCQMNKSDSERVAGYLEELGYKWINDRNQADLVVVNTCGIRQTAENRIYGIIPKIKKVNSNVKIILTGCLSEWKDVKKRLKDSVDIWLPIIDLPKLSEALRVTRYALRRADYLKIKPKYNSTFSAFVPIGNGCDNFCSYCVVPYARGREVYRSVEDIMDEVSKLVKAGYKEINLIAQNVNSYECDANPLINANPRIANCGCGDRGRKFINFAQLLRMVNDVEGDFWIRFLSSHPKDMSDELIKAIAECDKVCKHIHLPAQSGDNMILKAMNRNYTIEHYKKLIKKIRRAMPGASVTTDIIVGFPGETEEQFNNSKRLFKEMKFDMAYISQYSQRPGTVAEKLSDDVANDEKKRRKECLMEILRKTGLKNNKKYIGETVEILVEGKNRKGEWYGKTRTSKSVRIMNYELGIMDLVGKFVKVKIKKVRDFGFEATKVKIIEKKRLSGE